MLALMTDPLSVTTTVREKSLMKRILSAIFENVQLGNKNLTTIVFLVFLES